VLCQVLAAQPRANPRHDDVVFLTVQLRPMKRLAGKLLCPSRKREGEHAYLHKFRHTGATMFLWYYGNAFALMRILGHSTMTMVNRYVHQAEADIEDAHGQASPMYNMDLRVQVRRNAP
jgi:integrase/recombinase XerD